MKLTKAQRTAHAKFVREFKALVESVGVARDEDALYEYSIQTNVGVYHFNVDTLLDGYCTVFGRFDEPSRAKTRVDCNPFSGKWNFHFGILNTEPEAVTAAQRSAHQILSLIDSPSHTI